MNLAHVVLLACLAFAGLAAGNESVEVTFDGRKLSQREFSSSDSGFSGIDLVGFYCELLLLLG